MIVWDKVTKCIAAVGGAIAGLLGGWNGLLTLLVVAMVLDYISGLVVAWRGRSPKTEGGGLSSAVGFDGLAKKAFIMLIVLLASVLDRAIGDGTMFQTATVCYYIANEGLSLLENAALMGVPFPDKITDALEILKDKNNESDSGK